MKALSASRRLIWLGALLFLALIPCFLDHVLSLFFSESLYSRRGSFAYFVTIHEPLIRSFPILQATSEPLYHSGCGDGPKLPDEAIVYRSRLSAADLVTRMRPHIASHGFSPVSNDTEQPGMRFVNGRRTLGLQVTDVGDGTIELEAKILFGQE